VLVPLVAMPLRATDATKGQDGGAVTTTLLKVRWRPHRCPQISIHLHCSFFFEVLLDFQFQHYYSLFFGK
jgi:hypothetical protein